MKPTECKSITELKSVEVQEIYHNTKHYQKLLRKAKTDINKFHIDLLSLSSNDRKELGFRTWDKDSGEYELIPLYYSKLLPRETLVFCPLFKDESSKPIGSTDDDTRAGCIAYQIYKG